jgi:hypothetical protein
MHSNFSTKFMRETGGKEYFEKLMAAFDKNLDEHIAVYGPDNHLRLTGLHETQSIDKFTYGVADRGASIRVPHSFVNNGYKGYLEDRRPNSAADPVSGRRPDRQDDPVGADDLTIGSRLDFASFPAPFLTDGALFVWRAALVSRPAGAWVLPVHAVHGHTPTNSAGAADRIEWLLTGVLAARTWGGPRWASGGYRPETMLGDVARSPACLLTLHRRVASACCFLPGRWPQCIRPAGFWARSSPMPRSV